MSFLNGPMADSHQSYFRLCVADWAADCDEPITLYHNWLTVSDVSCHLDAHWSVVIG